MKYKMEELMPIVGRLAEKYTAFESTSITYEKAEQLMGAVLYCIHELAVSGRELPPEGEMWEYSRSDSGEMTAQEGKLSAQKAYEKGRTLVEEKVKWTLNLYNEMVPEFISYKNRCLHDTFIKGLPEFFKWYDVRFNPQDTILTLDYPVLADLSGFAGIDKIYEFVNAIRLEQVFLKAFPEEYVMRALAEYDDSFESMIDNICRAVLESVIVSILDGKNPDGTKWKKMQGIRLDGDSEKIKCRVNEEVKRLLQEHFEEGEALGEYFANAVDDIVTYLLKTSHKINKRFDRIGDLW